MLETMRLLLCWGGQGYSSVHHDTSRKISAHLVLSAKLRGCKRCWWRFSSSCRHQSRLQKRMPNARRQNLRYIKNQKSSRKLTWNLKITCLKRKILFQNLHLWVPCSFSGGHMSMPLNGEHYWPKMSAEGCCRFCPQHLQPRCRIAFALEVKEIMQNPPVLDHLDNKITYHISQYSYL